MVIATETRGPLDAFIYIIFNHGVVVQIQHMFFLIRSLLLEDCPFFGARLCYGNGQPPNQLSPACVALKAKRDLSKGAVKRVLSSRCSLC